MCRGTIERKARIHGKVFVRGEKIGRKARTYVYRIIGAKNTNIKVCGKCAQHIFRKPL